jgi:hypothetical protein
MREMIKANGSTPGFGWYNIALARCMHYDGQLAEATRYANKAAEFKELHIGTTLSQSHYDFSIQLIKLVNKQSELKRQIFENRNWWYNPNVLGKMGKILSEQYMQQFLIINQFAQNPERDRVIYKLFSTESTVSWDEVWYLIRDFSTQFFVDRFTQELKKDERKYVHKYFRFFIARLKMEMGDYKEAQIMLEQVLRDPNIDADYEKLFLARVYQAQAECAEKREDNKAYAEWMYRLYQTYPQLIPNVGMKMNMRLHVSGANEEVLKRLKTCNINWVENNTPAVDVYLSFAGTGVNQRVDYYVQDKGSIVVEKQALKIEKSEKAAVQLAYRLFNIGGKMSAREKAGEEV